MDGVLVVDKPEGWSSHDAVNKLRRLTNIRRIGHLGTLDPMATGVLPLVIGRATRLAQFFVRGEKIYDAVIRFGYATDTYDRDGTPTTPITEPQIDRPRGLEAALESFTGLLHADAAAHLREEDRRHAGLQARSQEPSGRAEAGGGHRLLDRASRAGRRPKPASWSAARAGTYMRSIAHDLGKALGCGAFLQSLCRKASGDFTLEQATDDQRIGGDGARESPRGSPHSRGGSCCRSSPARLSTR